MENNELTPEKSLQIINAAIDKSRKDFERNAGTPMIFWGAIVLLFSLAVWMLLILTGKLEWNFLWFGIPVIGWPLYPLVVKGKCKNGGKSFISRSIGQIWLAYGIFATVLAGVFAFIAPHLTGYLTVALLGYAAVMTGFVLKNKIITAGGFITGLCCTIALFFFEKEFSPLCVAVASVVNLIVPGIMMNRRVK